MNIGIIIQARMASTRLPGKILKPFYDDKSLIEIILERLHKVPDVKVIVATSVSKSNDPLEGFLENRGEFVYRGSETDVLDRYIKTAEFYKLDGIIRICSDNPFIDLQGVCNLVERAKSAEADYIGFRINDKPSILTHFGFWGEYVSLAALKHVAMTTDTDTPAHEHVTYHIYTNDHKYRCEWLSPPDFLQERNDIRLTVDTEEDFFNAKQVYSEIIDANPNFTLQNVIEYLDSHESIKNSMISNISQNSK